MKSLKKLASMLVLGMSAALLQAGCAMDVDDPQSITDDAASLEASETQATAVADQSDEATPEMTPLQYDGRDGYGHGGRCERRCWRDYRYCERHDRDGRHDGYGRDGHGHDGDDGYGRRCEQKLRRCLRDCRRH